MKFKSFYQMKQKPHISNREIVAQSRLFTVERFNLEFSNGAKRTYERLVPQRKGAVMIIPMLDDDTVILVREYAGGVDRYEINLPKGAIDTDEDAIDTVKRELQEEIGYAAKTIKPFTSLSASPGYMGASMQIFIARDLYKSSLEGDEPEPLEVIEWPLSKLKELIKEHKVSDSRTIAALYMLRDEYDNK